LLPNIEEEEFIGLDIEANSLEVWYQQWRMTIFSLSILSDNNEVISFWINWKLFKEDHISKFKSFLNKCQSQMWTFNCTYEIKGMWRLFSDRYKFNDALVLLTMDANRSNLKVGARKYLGINMWEGLVHKYLNTYESIFKSISNSKNKYEILKAINEISDYETLITKLTELKLPTSEIELINQQSEIDDEVTVMKSLSKYPYEWECVPYEILGEYCCYDSAYTVLLAKLLYDKYKEGYKYYITHPWLAAVFESYGCRWEDKVAQEVEAEFLGISSENLSQIILSLGDISAEKKLECREIMSYQLPMKLQWFTPTGKERWRDVNNEYDRIQLLKSIFNPGSNTASSRSLFWNTYNTERVKMATFLYAIISELRLRGIWDDLLVIITKDISVPEDVNLEKFIMKHYGVSNLLDKLLSVPENDNVSDEIRSVLSDAVVLIHENYLSKFTGRFAKEVLFAQYEIQRDFFGVDIDDPNTWNDEFRLLFTISKYKKADKALSTYVNGSLGRESVYLSKLNGNNPPLRIKKFDTNMMNYELKEDEILLAEYSFNSLAITTHRWSSGFHCHGYDNKILTNHGNITIGELYDKRDDLLIQDFVTNTISNCNELINKPIKDVLLSGYVDELIELELNNGHIIKVTPNHRFKTIHGYYITAENITEEVELLENYQEVMVPKFNNISECYEWLISIGFHNTNFSNECSQAIITDNFEIHFKDLY
jgi:hypothetical protein